MTQSNAANAANQPCRICKSSEAKVFGHDAQCGKIPPVCRIKTECLSDCDCSTSQCGKIPVPLKGDDIGRLPHSAPSISPEARRGTAREPEGATGNPGLDAALASLKRTLEAQEPDDYERARERYRGMLPVIEETQPDLPWQHLVVDLDDPRI